ncbi:hypothetical protein LNJ05_03060 [Tenacibaculum finnmarkense genomovar ulcerans]|uniref:hypothetical protein n=1 Tax=Tenacibaculum finnmarkense TaxID=2781243 RepID=UPI001E4D754A|nr:hypothetical protein [Tenacibaculum finnmarkense]MCD8431734.1 hypothetical protein [Tenacibaculum finnmarkense genomovar ulcerans]
MNHISHSEAFFIDKSFELLDEKGLDSLQLKHNNPKSCLSELKYYLEQYKLGKIQKYEYIIGKDTSLSEDIKNLIKKETYLKFKTVSKSYLLETLKNQDSKIDETLTVLEIMELENIDYIYTLRDKINDFLECENEKFALKEINEFSSVLNFFYVEIINLNIHKRYIINQINHSLIKLRKEIKHSTLNKDELSQTLKTNVSSFCDKLINKSSEDYAVYVKLTCNSDINEIISKTDIDFVTDNVSITSLKTDRLNNELSNFKTRISNKLFLYFEIPSKDYYSTLDEARKRTSEFLDLIDVNNNLKIETHSRVLVANKAKPIEGRFYSFSNKIYFSSKRTTEEIKSHLNKEINIISNEIIEKESIEKLKSSIHYLRMGNEANEIEHQFLNYWIGLEYLFSNNNKGNTIIRLKKHFSNAHTLIYLKRNLKFYYKRIEALSDKYPELILTNFKDDILKREFYGSIINKINEIDYPLIVGQAKNICSVYFKENGDLNFKGISENFTKHKTNIEIHLTRIYRIRNEIIHDAGTNTNNVTLTQNLQYYLSFIINDIINHFNNNPKPSSIEKYFLLNLIRSNTLFDKQSLDKDFVKDLINQDTLLGFIGV